MSTQSINSDSLSCSDTSDEPDQDYDIDLTETLVNYTNISSESSKQVADDDDHDDEEDDFIRSSSKKALFKAGAQALKLSQSKKKKNLSAITGGGSFQSLGLHPSLLRAISLRGFNTPTPIQRAVLPHILATPPRDVVGMARTGSGKTLAYLIPLIQALGGTHSIQFGIRALILLPTRELALQVLKVAKDLAKGFVQGDRSKSFSQDQESDLPLRKIEALRWGLVVGGDSLEDQFTMFASNPDVIIATPGRLLHLVVEMNLDLKSVTYVVFDEADRLFEMGFATQLEETLHRLPATRQTLLFSATLPKSLVEFAKAGLQNPKLIRLDSESKISSDLQMAFLTVKPIEKEAALFILINDIVGVPKNEVTEASTDFSSRPTFSQRGSGSNLLKVRVKPNHELTSHQTIVFTATKHHVEYLGGLLMAAGYQVSLIYGSMDQTARRDQLNAFRLGRTNILVVTDLAARGIDIPILENVINYDFPSSARAFVHRVGRTARAGRKGWAYSLITQSELPFLMDLQLFLSRPLVTCPIPANVDPVQIDFSSNLVIGSIPRDRLDTEIEYVCETLIITSSALTALGAVVKRAQKMYEKSQSAASHESYRRSKAFVFGGDKNQEGSIHLIFKKKNHQKGPLISSKNSEPEQDRILRDKLIAKVNQFRPNETVFEIGTRGKSVAAQLMRDRRKSVGNTITRTQQALKGQKEKLQMDQALEKLPQLKSVTQPSDSQTAAKTSIPAATELELEETFEMPRKRKKEKQLESFHDPTAYLRYEQAGAAAEKGYNLNEGTSSNFVSQSKGAIFDLGINDDEGKLKSMSNAQKASQVKWDRKTKKFVKVDQLGKDNIKLIKTESGLKLPISFKTGSFENWKKSSRIKIPKVGDQELLQSNTSFNSNSMHNKRFRHQSNGNHATNNKKQNNNNDDDQQRQQFNNNYNKNTRYNNNNNKVFKKTIDGQKKFLGPTHKVTRGFPSNSKSNFSGLKNRKNQNNFKSKSTNQINKAGLKSIDQICKARQIKEQRKLRSNHRVPSSSSNRRKK